MVAVEVGLLPMITIYTFANGELISSKSLGRAWTSWDGTEYGMGHGLSFP